MEEKAGLHGAVDISSSLMADGDWLMIFRSLETDDLIDRKRKLLDQITTLTSQSVGNKSLTRDLGHAQKLLSAITFVLNERGNPCGNPSYVITDFSERGRGQPAGTVEPY